MTGGIGHGLPWWLPDGFLNVERTLALGDVDLYLDPHLRCPACVAGIPKNCDAGPSLDPCHIVTKGLGGRPNGAGPTVRLCRPHHDLEHFSADGIYRTMAVRDRDGAICWLEYTPSKLMEAPEDIKVTILGHVHPWAW